MARRGAQMEQATTGLRERREVLVRDHMESENQYRSTWRSTPSITRATS